MKSRRASVRIESGLDRVDGAVQLLEDEWRRHGDVHLESFWAEQNRTGAVGAVDSVGGACRTRQNGPPTPFRRRAEADGCGIPRSVSRAWRGRQPGAEPGLRGVLPLRGARRQRGRRFVLRPLSGLEKLARVAAPVSSADQPGGGSAPKRCRGSRRRARHSRNFSSYRFWARGDVAGLPGQRPFAGGQDTSP